MTCSTFSVRGTPSTRATMLTPKVSCSWVFLYSWLRTTWGTASRLSSMTSRVPVRSDSSRRSAIPPILRSRTRSAIFSMMRSRET